MTLAPRVTLTFDNGPDPDVTPQVLDLLRARSLHAWFFVLGKHVATPWGRALVARTHAEGHRVGNHSYTHEVPLGLDARPDALAREVIATEALLDEVAPGPRFFRPFGGGGALGPHLLRPDVLRHLLDHGYTCALWNSVPRDWEDPIGWPARALDDCARTPHTVLVLHDIAGACLDGLARYLDGAAALGATFTLALPDACAPIVDGVARCDLAPFTAPLPDRNHP